MHVSTVSHAHRHTHRHTLTPGEPVSGAFTGDFTTAVLLTVPVKHETLLFPHLTTHSHAHTHTQAPRGPSFRTYTDEETRGAGVSSARPASRVRSCTELRTNSFAHLSGIFTALLHPPLNAAVKVEGKKKKRPSSSGTRAASSKSSVHARRRAAQCSAEALSGTSWSSASKRPFHSTGTRALLAVSSLRAPTRHRATPSAAQELIPMAEIKATALVCLFSGSWKMFHL